MRLRELKEYETSINIYDEIIKLDQKRKQEALIKKARILRIIGKESEALAQLVDAENVKPLTSYALLEKAIILQKLGNFQESETLLKGAEEQNFLKEDLDEIAEKLKKDTNGNLIEPLEEHLYKLLYQREEYNENREIACQRSREYRQLNKEIVHACDKRNYDKNKERKNLYKRKRIYLLWEEALNFFGPCAKCGENRREFLAIDHIKNDGAFRRKVKKEPGGGLLIAKFKRMGWPEYLKEDYRILCHNCNESTFPKNTIKLWQEAFDFFGPCSCCGETNINLLCIDHIYGRKSPIYRPKTKRALRGKQLLSSFKTHGWPKELKEVYRLLCYNCNHSFGTFKECPHQKENTEIKQISV
jgi:hypothetical protein